jgi:hypothetical protein
LLIFTAGKTNIIEDKLTFNCADTFFVRYVKDCVQRAIRDLFAQIARLVKSSFADTVNTFFSYDWL